MSFISALQGAGILLSIMGGMYLLGLGSTALYYWIRGW